MKRSFGSFRYPQKREPVDHKIFNLKLLVLLLAVLILGVCNIVYVVTGGWL